MKKRIFSGIKPSGRPHIGNYLGAMKQHVALSKDTSLESFFCLVDYHALTTLHDAAKLRSYTKGIIIDFLALGLDHDNATIFIQSDVPEHTELSWILSNYVAAGRMARVPTFKEKKLEQPDDVNFGLMSYAALMAADILLYKTDVVPVGIDQVPHIEIARDIAKTFNMKHGETFIIPEVQLHKGTEKILGIDGVKKMSKTVGNTIELFATEDETLQRVKQMVTDPQKIRKDDPGRPEVCNVFSFHNYFSDQSLIDSTEKNCKSGVLGCVDCKTALAKNINTSLAQFREKRKDLENNPKLIDDILQSGKEKAKKVARETMQEVRKKVGLD